MHLKESFALKILLVLLVLVGTWYKFDALSSKTFLSYDEAISSITVNAKEGEYYEVIRAGQVTAGDIQELINAPSAGFFETALDMSTCDNHPALFYYLMGRLKSILDVEYLQLKYFNVLLQLLSLVLLYFLSRKFLSNELALLTCLLWYCSPGVFQNYFEIRHYPLLEFFCLGYFYSFYSWLDRPKLWKNILLLGLFFCLGALTHYYMIMIAGAFGLSLLRLKNLKTIIGFGAIHLAVLVIILAAVNTYFNPFLAKVSNIEEGAVEAAGRTISQSLYLLTMFSSKYFGESVILAAIVLLALGYGFVKNRSSVMGIAKSAFPVLLPLSLLIVFSSILYLVGMAPVQAVGYEYFCYIWALLTLAIVMLYREQKLLLYALIPMFSIGSIEGVENRSRYIDSLPPELTSELSQAERIEVSEYVRGYIPRIANLTPPECAIERTVNIPDEDKWCMVVDGSTAHRIEFDTFVVYY